MKEFLFDGFEVDPTEEVLCGHAKGRWAPWHREAGRKRRVFYDIATIHSASISQVARERASQGTGSRTVHRARRGYCNSHTTRAISSLLADGFASEDEAEAFLPRCLTSALCRARQVPREFKPLNLVARPTCGP